MPISRSVRYSSALNCNPFITANSHAVTYDDLTVFFARLLSSTLSISVYRREYRRWEREPGKRSHVMTTLPREVHHVDVTPRAHELECRVRAAVFQAGLVIGAGIAERRNSGDRHAHRDGALACHGAGMRRSTTRRRCACLEPKAGLVARQAGS